MTGFLRQDNDCRWYFIPTKEIYEFDDIQCHMDQINTFSEAWHDLNEEFIDKYSQYIIDSPFSLKLKQVAA
jgi:hypothetical protein